MSQLGAWLHMKEYMLAKELNQKIVDGIIEGYREYLEVRREKAKALKVHSAYAWVKGNHIDHHVAVACKPLGVESKVAKAGLTWQYLQFENEDKKMLFIVKNARYFNPEEVNIGKDALGQTRSTKITYMQDLININSGIHFINSLPVKSKEPQQLELELLEDYWLREDDNDAIAKIKTNYDRFYIVTYEIDEGYQISEIRLWMPNPANNKAYLIDNLTTYINASHTIEIEEELINVLTNSVNVDDFVDAHKFGIVIDDAEEQQS